MHSRDVLLNPPWLDKALRLLDLTQHWWIPMLGKINSLGVILDFMALPLAQCLLEGGHVLDVVGECCQYISCFLVLLHPYNQ